MKAKLKAGEGPATPKISNKRAADDAEDGDANGVESPCTGKAKKTKAARTDNKGRKASEDKIKAEEGLMTEDAEF